MFGNKSFMHIPQLDTRPWLCINKVKTDINIENIVEYLKSEHDITAIDAHRPQKHKEHKSNLIKFKIPNHQYETHALNTTITIDGNKHKIRKFIDTEQTRCTNCQQFGHVKTKCKQKVYTCVRCARTDCVQGDCQSNVRKCANCHGAHSASYKNCTTLKTLQRNTLQKHVQQDKETNVTKQIKQITSREQTHSTITEKHTQTITELQENIAVHNEKHTEEKGEIHFLKQQNTELQQTIRELQDKLHVETTKNKKDIQKLNNSQTTKKEMKEQIEQITNAHIQQTITATAQQAISAQIQSTIQSTIKQEITKQTNDIYTNVISEHTKSWLNEILQKGIIMNVIKPIFKDLLKLAISANKTITETNVNQHLETTLNKVKTAAEQNIGAKELAQVVEKVSETLTEAKCEIMNGNDQQNG